MSKMFKKIFGNKIYLKENSSIYFKEQYIVGKTYKTIIHII